MKCLKCGNENKPGKNFCTQCGARFDIVCPNCGDHCDPQDKFCGVCGGSLFIEINDLEKYEEIESPIASVSADKFLPVRSPGKVGWLWLRAGISW